MTEPTPIHDSVKKDQERDAQKTKELADKIREWVEKKGGK